MRICSCKDHNLVAKEEKKISVCVNVRRETVKEEVRRERVERGDRERERERGEERERERVRQKDQIGLFRTSPAKIPIS